MYLFNNLFFLRKEKEGFYIETIETNDKIHKTEISNLEKEIFSK